MLQARPTLGVCFLSQPYFVYAGGSFGYRSFGRLLVRKDPKTLVILWSLFVYTLDHVHHLEHLWIGREDYEENN